MNKRLAKLSLVTLLSVFFALAAQAAGFQDPPVKKAKARKVMIATSVATGSVAAALGTLSYGVNRQLRTASTNLHNYREHSLRADLLGAQNNIANQEAEISRDWLLDQVNREIAPGIHPLPHYETGIPSNYPEMLEYHVNRLAKRSAQSGNYSSRQAFSQTQADHAKQSLDDIFLKYDKLKASKPKALVLLGEEPALTEFAQYIEDRRISIESLGRANQYIRTSAAVLIGISAISAAASFSIHDSNDDETTKPERQNQP